MKCSRAWNVCEFREIARFAKFSCTWIFAPWSQLPVSFVNQHEKWSHSLNNGPIFNPKPLSESWGPRLCEISCTRIAMAQIHEIFMFYSRDKRSRQTYQFNCFPNNLNVNILTRNVNIEDETMLRTIANQLSTAPRIVDRYIEFGLISRLCTFGIFGSEAPLENWESPLLTSANHRVCSLEQTCVPNNFPNHLRDDIKSFGKISIFS